MKTSIRKTSMSSLTKKLGKLITVENAPSRNGCGKAPNQFIVTYSKGTVFQSYNTIVGARIGTQMYFGYAHDCSQTTSSYLTRWCGYSASERRKGLESGEFITITK